MHSDVIFFNVDVGVTVLGGMGCTGTVSACDRRGGGGYDCE